MSCKSMGNIRSVDSYDKPVQPFHHRSAALRDGCDVTCTLTKLILL